MFVLTEGALLFDERINGRLVLAGAVTEICQLRTLMENEGPMRGKAQPKPHGSRRK